MVDRSLMRHFKNSVGQYSSRTVTLLISYMLLNMGKSKHIETLAVLAGEVVIDRDKLYMF